MARMENIQPGVIFLVLMALLFFPLMFVTLTEGKFVGL